MRSKRWLIILGTVLSIVLLVIVFARLDWQAFLTALTRIQLTELILAAAIVALNVALRALRWNLVAHRPLTQFKYFWQAANIGYLGNIIYPARAGEVLRIVAIHHFAQLVVGRALSSAIIDRMLDMIVAGLFTLLVLWLHSYRVNPSIGMGVIVLFVVASTLLIALTLWIDQLHLYVQRWQLNAQWQKLHQALLQALEGIQSFRQTHNITLVITLTLVVFMLDYFWMWQIMRAFDWALPFEAAITVGVFILLGISLPSAPGYIGIYQVACVLALGFYGIEQAQAVAYSIVLQLLSFMVMGIQGILVIIYCGFNFSQESRHALGEETV